MQVTQHKLPLCGMSCKICGVGLRSIISTPQLRLNRRPKNVFFSRMPGGSKLIPLGANYIVHDEPVDYKTSTWFTATVSTRRASAGGLRPPGRGLGWRASSAECFKLGRLHSPRRLIIIAMTRD